MTARPPEPVLIAGAGALGSVVGGMLARAGWAVTLLGRAAHLDVVRADGLRIDGLFGSHLVRDVHVATTSDQLAERYGAILLTVKSWDTRPMSEAVAPHLAADGWILSLQNGLGNLETVADVVGQARVIGARVIFGAELQAPGHVQVTVIADPVAIGASDPTDGEQVAAARGWAEAFDAAGIPTRFSEDVRGDLWAKVLYNSALNPLGALLGVPYGYLAAHDDTRAVMNAVLDETFAVATRAGVTLPWGDSAAYRAVFYERLVPATAKHRSSMLQDLERGRPTEIDAINGHVARLGARLGVPTPTTDALTRLIRAKVQRMRERDSQ